MERERIPYITVKDNTVLGISVGFLDLTGYRADEVLGTSLDHLVRNLLEMTADITELHPSYQNVFICTKNMEQKEVDVSVWACEETADIYFYEHADSRIKHLLQRINKLETENAKLKTEANRFKIITDYMNDGLMILNSDGTYDYFNVQAKRMSPVSGIKKIGDSLSHATYYSVDERILTKEELPSSRVLTGETLNNVRIRIESPEVSGCFSYSGCPIYNKDGVLTSAVVCFRDVTKIYDYGQKITEQKKQMEAAVETLNAQNVLLEETVQKLRQSEMQLRMASEGARVGIYVFDFDSDKGYWSPMFKEIHGVKENDDVPLDENKVFTGLHPEDLQRFLKAIQKANHPGGDGIADLEYRIITQDGKSRWLRIRGQTYFAGEGSSRRPTMVGGAVTDITNRVVAENNVKRLSEELQSIIDSTEDLIWSVDREYKLQSFNAAFKNVIKNTFGLTLKQNMPMKEVFKKDTVWQELYERAVSDGKFKVDLTSPHNDRMYSYSFYPIYVDSEVVEITCFAKDQTERRKTEQRIVSENSLLESTIRERTAELQQMVKNLQNFSLAISHDVKAAFRDIEIYANNILGQNSVEENAESILQVSRDMTSFIHGIMKYEMYSRQNLVKEDVNIKRIFNSVYKELKSKYSNPSQLAFKTGFPTVLADKILLRQVVSSVLSNALKFSSKREMAKIAISCTEDNNEYVFYVEDNGVGFDMNDAPKLFYPFGRLHEKEDFEGNGLGLSIVRNIIQRHGGRTWIESETDVKTVIYFSLPKS